jgi:hypothetical protein
MAPAANQGSANSVATVALRGGGFIDGVKRRADVELWQVARANHDALPAAILARLRRRLDPKTKS